MNVSLFAFYIDRHFCETGERELSCISSANIVFTFGGCHKLTQLCSDPERSNAGTEFFNDGQKDVNCIHRIILKVVWSPLDIEKKKIDL